MPLGGYGVLIEGHSRDIFTNYSRSDVSVSSGSADAFGSWVEMIADVGDRDILITSVLVTGSFTVATSGVECELGIGASSSEVRIFAFVTKTEQTNDTAGYSNLSMSLRVPSGSRVSARMKDSVSADEYDIGINYIKL